MTIFDRKAASFALALLVVCSVSAELASVALAAGTGGQITDHKLSVRLLQPTDANGTALNLFDTPLSKADCDAPRALQIQYAPPNLNIGVMYIFASTSTDCALPTDVKRYINSGGEQVNTVGSPADFPKVADIEKLSTKTILGDQCTEGTAEVDLSSFALCVVYKDTTNADDTKNKVIDLLQVRVDTKPPAKLTDVSLTPGDGVLTASWTEVETTNIKTYHLIVVRNEDDTPVRELDVTAPVATARLDGLENGKAYTVYITAFDIAGNEGEPSDALVGTPVPTCDFWNCYQGREKGGFCFISTAAYGSYDAPFVQVFRDFRDRVLMQNGYGRAFILWYYKNGLPAALWLMKHEWARKAVGVALVVPYVLVWPFMRLTPLGLLAFFGGIALLLVSAAWLWRRRRVALVLGSVLLLSSEPVFAADDTFELLEIDDHTGRGQVAPPPRFEIGVKIGPYYPAIDTDADANNLYGTFFADGDFRQGIFTKNTRVRADLNLDVYVLQKWGLLGFTGTAGFWTAAGKARNCENDACSTIDGLRAAAKTNDEVAMFIIPLSIGIVYKLDIFWRRWGVPLIPYVRGGIDAYFWRVNVGTKHARVAGSTYTNDLKANGFGHGVTFGAHVNPGLAFALDVIEPDAARRAYSFLGIKGSYLTAEWMFAFIDDFGSASSWNLSHSTFNGGIAVEF